jgi:VWFA-related protein
LFGLSPAFAQEIAQPKPSTTPTIHLDVVVTPKSGTPPTPGLRQQDFTLLDNKVPQAITSFQAMGGPQAPVEVVLVLDAVNTSYQQIAFQRGEVNKFLHANGGHLAYPTTLAIFTDTGTQIQSGYTTDGNAMSESFDHFAIGLRDLRRSAGFWGAQERFQLSMKALQLLTSKLEAQPGRKLILWMSPGWPILSGPGIVLDAKEDREIFSSIVEVSNQLRQAQITLYSLDGLGVDEGLGRTLYYQGFLKGVGDLNQVQLGDLSLQVLAVQSGGLALSSTGVFQSLQRCVADAEAYYEISFSARPGEKPNEYHSLEVKVNQSGMVARTRQGYYAQP